MLVVFTIGHSTRTWKVFLELLRAHGIKRFIDVRSIPAHDTTRSSTERHCLRSCVPRGLAMCIKCGVLLSGAGFGVMMWAWWQFRQRGNPICPTEGAHEVISAGPYRVTRNPMYLGILAILSGASLIMRSIPVLVAPVGFFN